MDKELKETALPKWFDGTVYNEGAVVTNPLSGESYELTANETAMYDLVMGANLLQQWKIVQKGCDWFRKANPAAYMVLLD